MAEHDEWVLAMVIGLLYSELEIPEETDLQIQQAHRTGRKKLPSGAPPKTIVVNFLKFETKESILTQKAW